MGAACTKSKGTAAPAARPSTTDRATEAAAAAAEHSQKAQEAAEEAIACAAKATEEAAGLTGQAPEEETQPKEVEEQQAVATPEQTQTHAEEVRQTSALIPLSEADEQLLAAAEQQTAASKQQEEAAGVNTPQAYLFYASELNEGSLILQWTPTKMNEEEINKKKLILLASFIPAKHKTVSKSKLTQNAGITSFLQEMKYKWDIWNKSQRQAYFQGWIKFIKAADEMEASLKIYKFDMPAPPVKVFLLHTGPIENKVLPVKEEDAFNISAFGFVAVTPPPPPYKAGANITPKRFGEIATGAGGAYLQLSRRGGDAAFDEAEVVRWLAADGLEIKKGEGITMGAAGSYERRSDKKGGNAAAESAAPT